MERKQDKIKPKEIKKNVGDKVFAEDAQRVSRPTEQKLPPVPPPPQEEKQ